MYSFQMVTDTIATSSAGTTLKVPLTDSYATSNTLTEITGAVSLSKSSVHNPLTTLEHLGLLVRTDSRYRVSLRFLEVGATVRDQSPLYRGSRAEVERLAGIFDLAAGVVAFERDRTICLYTTTGHRVDRAPLQQGDVVPVHASAAGKAILATLAEQELDRVLETLEPDS